MIIIVEGIDRVGKSTLCKKLEGIGFTQSLARIWNTSRDNELVTALQNERTIAQAQILQLIHDKVDIVIDRFHLSQIVYSMHNRDCDVTSTMLEVDKMLGQMDSLLLYVQPTNLERSSKEHGSDLLKHVETFDEMFAKSSMQKLKLNYKTIQMAVDIVRRIKKCK